LGRGDHRPAEARNDVGTDPARRTGTVDVVHPIERLRYVARSQGGDQRTLVDETAGALRGLGLDHAGLVVACRRILQRHPSSGPLWWLCASVLSSTDPLGTARRLAREIDDDGTADVLIDVLPADGVLALVGWPDLAAEAVIRRGDLRALVVENDESASFVRRLAHSDVDAEVVPAAGAAAAADSCALVVVEALATSSSTLLATTGSRALAAAAYCAGVPVWAVIGHGRRLPDQLFAAVVGRSIDAERPWQAAVETVPFDLCTVAVLPDGHHDVAGGAGGALLTPECPLASELLRTSAM
jgi:hypothetical protein